MRATSSVENAAGKSPKSEGNDTDVDVESGGGTDTGTSNEREKEEEEEKVPLWNPIYRMKITGLICPTQENLSDFLNSHPEFEVYSNQDKKETLRKSFDAFDKISASAGDAGSYGPGRRSSSGNPRDRDYDTDIRGSSSSGGGGGSAPKPRKQVGRPRLSKGGDEGSNSNDNEEVEEEEEEEEEQPVVKRGRGRPSLLQSTAGSSRSRSKSRGPSGEEVEEVEPTSTTTPNDPAPTERKKRGRPRLNKQTPAPAPAPAPASKPVKYDDGIVDQYGQKGRVRLPGQRPPAKSSTSLFLEAEREKDPAREHAKVVRAAAKLAKETGEPIIIPPPPPRDTYITSYKQKLLEERLELKFPVGTRVEGNYRKRGWWYPGVVRELCGDGTIALDYDDGGKEKVTEWYVFCYTYYLLCFPFSWSLYLSLIHPLLPACLHSLTRHGV
jgi:hypothetical protein